MKTFKDRRLEEWRKLQESYIYDSEVSEEDMIKDMEKCNEQFLSETIDMAVSEWFKENKPIILIKDKNTNKTLDQLELVDLDDKVGVFHNGVFVYKSSNGKEREEYFKSLSPNKEVK